jgi:hypothetical protein
LKASSTKWLIWIVSLTLSLANILSGISQFRDRDTLNCKFVSKNVNIEFVTGGLKLEILREMLVLFSLRSANKGGIKDIVGKCIFFDISRSSYQYYWTSKQSFVWFKGCFAAQKYSQIYCVIYAMAWCK